jgi:hypothetical protein
VKLVLRGIPVGRRFPSPHVPAGRLRYTFAFTVLLKFIKAAKAVKSNVKIGRAHV